MRLATREQKHKVVLEPATQAQENRAGLSFAPEHLQRFGVEPQHLCLLRKRRYRAGERAQCVSACCSSMK